MMTVFFTIRQVCICGSIVMALGCDTLGCLLPRHVIFGLSLCSRGVMMVESQRWIELQQHTHQKRKQHYRFQVSQRYSKHDLLHRFKLQKRHKFSVIQRTTSTRFYLQSQRMTSPRPGSADRSCSWQKDRSSWWQLRSSA